MSSHLLQIGRSGTRAARTALELTAQNIANANNASYARRTAATAEIVASGTIGLYTSSALGGVRVDHILRSDSAFLQNEARRTGSEAARAAAELNGLRQAEAAIDQAGLYPAMVEFEAFLGRLQGDPLNSALRTSVLETARSLTSTFHTAQNSLAAARDGAQFVARSDVESVNRATTELGSINAALLRTQPGTSGHASLLDRRDAQLSDLARAVGVAVEYRPDGAVNVRLGDSSGPYLVNGIASGLLASTGDPDGTLSFSLDGNAITVSAGNLAGQARSLEDLRDAGAELDALSALLIQTANDAQAAGATPDGIAGSAFFSGTSASDIAVALQNGAGIATAPAGSNANSRDASNLTALQTALATNGPTSEADRILFDLSARVNSLGIAHESLSTIAQSAQSALARETAVDLDNEAANLVRFQQAFQASGRVIEVANQIFDSILGIR